MEEAKKVTETEFNNVHTKNYDKRIHQLTPDNLKAMYSAIFEEKKKDDKKGKIDH